MTYGGFDHHGNALSGRPTIEDFFNETNDNGFRTRPIGAYEPIYIAGYVMDKLTFDDIIFNVFAGEAGLKRCKLLRSDRLQQLPPLTSPPQRTQRPPLGHSLDCHSATIAPKRV